FTRQLASDANNAGVLLGRALARWKQSHAADMLLDLDRVVELDQGFAPVALALRARSNTVSGKASAATADFARAFKLAKNDPTLLLLHGTGLAADKKFAQAEHDLKLAYQALETAPEGARWLGLLHAAWAGATPDDSARKESHLKRALELAQQT